MAMSKAALASKFGAEPDAKDAAALGPEWFTVAQFAEHLKSSVSFAHRKLTDPKNSKRYERVWAKPENQRGCWYYRFKG